MSSPAGNTMLASQLRFDGIAKPKELNDEERAVLYAIRNLFTSY
jgi:hypothetical protein